MEQDIKKYKRLRIRWKL